MVRSLGWARAAALIGVTAEASSTAPTSAARSRRFHGARLRYSRRMWSGSGWAAPVTLRPFRARVPAGGADHAEAELAERALQHPTQRRLVVHDEERGKGGAGDGKRARFGHELKASTRGGVRKRCTTRSSASSGLSDSRISPAVSPR